MAAPSQFTDERANRIVEAIRLGATRIGAASCAGLSPAGLYLWFKRGRLGEQPFADLWKRVEESKRAYEVEALKIIDRAAQDGAWQAAAWKLERLLPKRYGRKLQLDDDKINRLVEARLQQLIDEAKGQRGEPKQIEAVAVNGVHRGHDGE